MNGDAIRSYISVLPNHIQHGFIKIGDLYNLCAVSQWYSYGKPHGVSLFNARTMNMVSMWHRGKLIMKIVMNPHPHDDIILRCTIYFTHIVINIDIINNVITVIHC